MKSPSYISLIYDFRCVVSILTSLYATGSLILPFNNLHFPERAAGNYAHQQVTPGLAQLQHGRHSVWGLRTEILTPQTPDYVNHYTPLPPRGGGGEITFHGRGLKQFLEKTFYVGLRGLMGFLWLEAGL